MTLILRFLCTNMDHKKSTEKMAKASVEFIFHHLGKLSVETIDYDEIPLCKTLFFVRYMGLLAK
jgi:hypothetical protein